MSILFLKKKSFNSVEGMPWGTPHLPKLGFQIRGMEARLHYEGETWNVPTSYHGGARRNDDLIQVFT